MSQDRRGKPRFPLEGTMIVEDHDEGFPVRVLDISDSGLRFEADRRLPPETLFKVILDYYPVDVPLRALVVWARDLPDGRFEHGGEFVNLPRAEQVLVHDFIEEQQKG